jgi:alpha-1,3-rhamnosyl/mannosyltransferase
MACGVPVVCSALTSLPEIAADAAVYANPQSPPEFAAGLGRVFSNAELRAQLIEKGYKNCARFSWESAARSVLAAYDHVADVTMEKAVCA